MSAVPLHPAVVHFPIVLSVLLPIAAIIALALIWRGRAQRGVWLVPVTMSAMLLVAAFVALRTGQNEEERVEEVVGESALGAHEEAAEQFLIFSGILLVVAAAGMVPGNVGRSARVLGTVGALAITVMGFRVGKAGGELVYKHGAAGVYATGLTPAGEAVTPEGNSARERDDDD